MWDQYDPLTFPVGRAVSVASSTDCRIRSAGRCRTADNNRAGTQRRNRSLRFKGGGTSLDRYPHRPALLL